MFFHLWFCLLVIDNTYAGFQISAHLWVIDYLSKPSLWNQKAVSGLETFKLKAYWKRALSLFCFILSKVWTWNFLSLSRLFWHKWAMQWNRLMISEGYPEDLLGLLNWLPELLPFQPVPSNDLRSPTRKGIKRWVPNCDSDRSKFSCI